ncbi:MAG: hypothetical protein GXP28_08665 [Planctomycetes bacterium]|nr:hypothetical protein [Planctomycetota bacterium]
MATTASSVVLNSIPLGAGQEAICSICQTNIRPDENCVTCPSCDQIHHQECWSEVGGCGTYGCKEASAVDNSEATSSTPLTAWGDTKKCPACGEEIKSIALRCRYCKTEFSSVDPMSVIDLRSQAHASDKTDQLKNWVIGLFVLSLLGCLAPITLIVSMTYLLPKQETLKRCGPLFVIMGWTSIVLSTLYTVLLLLFFLFQEI